MIIDSNKIRKSFYPQSGVFSFSASVIPSTTVGEMFFGFSAEKKAKVEFKFKDGKIFDWRSNFVGVYEQGIAALISGDIGSGSADYYINGEPIAFGLKRSAGHIDGWYAASYTSPAEFDLLAFGEKPSYSLSAPVSFSTGDSTFPISITNNSPFSFKIFSGSYDGASNLFSISGGSVTGEVSDTHTFYMKPNGVNSAGSFLLPFTFYTSFGTIKETVAVSGVRDYFENLSLTLSGPSNIRPNSSVDYIAQFSNDNGLQIPLMPFLTHLDGSGAVNSIVNLTGYYDVTFSAPITGSGFVGGPIYITGSGFGGFTNSLKFDTLSSYMSGFQWATGSYSETISVPVFGRATGMNYDGPASGVLPYEVTAFISSGSGSFRMAKQVTGAPAIAYSTNPTGQIKATGGIIYNSPGSEDILYINDFSKPIIQGYHFSNITGLAEFINSKSGDYLVSATNDETHIYLTSLLTGHYGNSIITETASSNLGTLSFTSSTLLGGQSLGIGTPVTPVSDFTGVFGRMFYNTGIYTQRFTGQLVVPSNIFDFYKNFTDTWNLSTGTSANNLISFKEKNWIVSNGASYASLTTPGGINGSFYMRVSYSYMGGNTDSAILGLSGVNTNKVAQITIEGLRG